jgi:hypothetical protein
MSIKKIIDSLKPYNRPVVCNEYLALKYNSLFTNMPPHLKSKTSAR